MTITKPTHIDDQGVLWSFPHKGQEDGTALAFIGSQWVTSEVSDRLFRTLKPINPSPREWLEAVHLDWTNNYLTVATFADHYGLHLDEAQALIDLSIRVADNQHPDA